MRPVAIIIWPCCHCTIEPGQPLVRQGLHVLQDRNVFRYYTKRSPVQLSCMCQKAWLESPQKEQFCQLQQSKPEIPIFRTDASTCCWFGSPSANPARKQALSGGETSPLELSNTWQRQQEGCTQQELGKRSITNKWAQLVSTTETKGTRWRRSPSGQTTRPLWPAPGPDHSRNLYDPHQSKHKKG